MKHKDALELRGACLAAGLAFLLSVAHADKHGPSLLVDVDGGSATVIANDVPLTEVLEAIALQTGIIVYSRAPLDTRVTYTINDVAIPELIRRILKGRNFTLHYVSDIANGQPVFGSRVWILTDDATPTTPVWSVGDTEQDRLRAIANIETWEDVDDIDPKLLVALNDPAVSVREEAVHILGELDPSKTRAYLRDALYDRDTKVRVASIGALADSDSDDAAIILADLLSDRDRAIRSEVIHAMAEIGSDVAHQFLRQALSDANAVNRETAASYLAEIATTKTASRF
jgi:hypothetical protein